jgi:hypothetical protein
MEAESPPNVLTRIAANAEKAQTRAHGLLTARVQEFEAALNLLKRESKQYRRKLNTVASLREMTDLVAQTACESEQTPILLLDREMKVLLRVCKALCVVPTIEAATINTRARSQYTVTKDCGVDEVGWEERDAGDRRVVVDSTDAEFCYDECLVSAGAGSLDFDSFEVGAAEYDGDQHGVWATASAWTSALIVTKLTVVVCASFSQESDLYGAAHVAFSPEVNGKDCIDVSNIVTGEFRPFEGVLYSTATGTRFGDASGGGGDWFWSWDRLAQEFAAHARQLLTPPGK